MTSEPFVFDDTPPPPESFETAIPAQAGERKVMHHALDHERPGAETPVAARAQDRRAESPRVVAGPSRADGARPLPADTDAEEALVSCLFVDAGEVLQVCSAAGISEGSFTSPELRAVYAQAADLAAAGQPVDTVTVALGLKGQLQGVNVFALVANLETTTATTAQAAGLAKKVRDAELLRALHLTHLRGMEDVFAFSGDVSDLLKQQQARLQKLADGSVAAGAAKPRGLFDFALQKDGDTSILLGDRYLNRGDAAVIVSTSGMGKSALSIQMATELALGRPPFGIRASRPLRSLIVQSEDSEGDVAEVAASMRHVLNLTPEQVATVNAGVRVVTERVLRGDRFIASLRRLIAEFKPDLVWLNPLQAFIDGDVTDSQDLGRFLREGLNGLNHDSAFGYVIVHHTTKPATGKERATRLWHEVMYDMAGGAEIINWARAILSLRAAEKEGEFNLVLAKRGRRAGVTRKVEQGAGYVEEIVTTIPLKHATGRIQAPGVSRGLPVIFWEGRTPDAEPEKGERGGRPTKYEFSVWRNVFPQKSHPGLPLAQLHRIMEANAPIPKKSLHATLRRWIEEGSVEDVGGAGQPSKYRMAFERA